MRIVTALVGALVITTPLPAMAATVAGSAITESPQYGTDVHYRFGTRPSNVGSFGGSYWDIAGRGSFFQVCAELFDHDEIAPLYSVTSGIATFGDFRDAQLTALFANAYPLLDGAVNAYVAANGDLTYNAGLDAQWNTIGAYSVSLQTLTWSIIENQQPMIAPADTSTVFGILDDGLGDPEATGYILGWAANINSGLWAPNDNVRLFSAAASDSAIQDRYWMSMTDSAVPEPASWAMMIFGMGMIGAALRLRARPVRRAIA